MTFITYVFLGLCLPMVALCAEEECACRFPRKLLFSIEFESPETNYESEMYINTDEKWAFQKDGSWRYTAYDLKTMTLYELDGKARTCKTSSISESDHIFKYQCIDKMAVKYKVEYRRSYDSGKYSYIANNPGYIMQSYLVVKADGSGECDPDVAEFRLDQGGTVVVRYRRHARGSYYKKMYDKSVEFCMKH